VSLPADESGEDVGETFHLTAAESADRLDRWLADRLTGRSRSEVQRWIADGRVTAGGRPAKASQRVEVGTALAITLPARPTATLVPEAIPLSIVFENADLLVVDKPAGMVVHPGPGNLSGTLVSAVLHHAPELEGIGGAHRPGIVHRLDKDTSGLILVAKNDQAQRALQAQFQARQVRKLYLALGRGMRTNPFVVAAWVGRDPKDRKRMAALPEGQGRAATTRVVPVAHYRPVAMGVRHGGDQPLTLLHCFPLTGRTHQIRVHLAYVGLPIAGDAVYGPRGREAPQPPRQFLHAHRLAFRLPSTGEEVEFVSPLPADLASFLSKLELVEA
jgi:23S rRNA pseudouridine1911/1915/1917 synthase